MKKVKFISLVMVLSFVLMGVAFAAWTENITINGTVATGNYDVTFTSAASNDAGVTVDQGKDRNVGVTEATIAADSKSITVTGTNAYPGYNATLTYKVKNTGTIPVKVNAANVVIPAASDGKITVTASDPAGVVLDPDGEYTGTVLATVTDAAAESTGYSYTVTVTTAQWQ